MDEFSTEAVELDLFGRPIEPIRDRRGRPSFAKSQENQELVTVLRAAGWNHDRIARIIGCDEKTLRKHFSRELDVGADIVAAEALMVTYRKMREGNSVATGRVLELSDRSDLAKPQRRPAAKPERLGKKEKADRDAKSAHEQSDWADLLH